MKHAANRHPDDDAFMWPKPRTVRKVYMIIAAHGLKSVARHANSDGIPANVRAGIRFIEERDEKWNRF